MNRDYSGWQGSRVGDAIAAAGGYSAQVDIAAATSGLNLAEVLVDGQQVHVPLRGETASPPIAAGASQQPAAGGGLSTSTLRRPKSWTRFPVSDQLRRRRLFGRQETPVRQCR